MKEQLLPPVSQNETKWHVLTDRKLTSLIIRAMKASKQDGIIRLYCGTAALDVFNDRFLKAARRIHKNTNTTIRAITGPVVAVDGDNKNPLFTLRDEGIVTLLKHRITRDDHPQFRLVETTEGYLYSVDAYPPPSNLKEHQHLVATLKEPRDGSLAEGAMIYFDSTVEMLENSSDPSMNEVPILLRANKIHALVKKTKEKRLRYHHVRPETILWLLHEQTPKGVRHKARASSP